MQSAVRVRVVSFIRAYIVSMNVYITLRSHLCHLHLIPFAYCVVVFVIYNSLLKSRTKKHNHMVYIHFYLLNCLFQLFVTTLFPCHQQQSSAPPLTHSAILIDCLLQHRIMFNLLLVYIISALMILVFNS